MRVRIRVRVSKVDVVIRIIAPQEYINRDQDNTAFAFNFSEYFRNDNSGCYRKYCQISIENGARRVPIIMKATSDIHEVEKNRDDD